MAAQGEDIIWPNRDKNEQLEEATPDLDHLPLILERELTQSMLESLEAWRRLGQYQETSAMLEHDVLAIARENSVLNTTVIAQTEKISKLQAEVKKAKDDLLEMADGAIYSAMDVLTGLFRRDTGEIILNRLLNDIECNTGTLSHQIPIALLLVDMDWFRNVNDTYGHPGGDAALLEISRIIKRHSRDYDIAIRWGGEELLLVLVNAGLDTAVQRAESLRELIEATPLPYTDADGKSHLIRTTASIGVSLYDHSLSLETNINMKADPALYSAKSSGRNQVAVFENDTRRKRKSPNKKVTRGSMGKKKAAS